MCDVRVLIINGSTSLCTGWSMAMHHTSYNPHCSNNNYNCCISILICLPAYTWAIPYFCVTRWRMGSQTVDWTSRAHPLCTWCPSTCLSPAHSRTPRDGSHKIKKCFTWRAACNFYIYLCYWSPSPACWWALSKNKWHPFPVCIMVAHCLVIMCGVIDTSRKCWTSFLHPHSIWNMSAFQHYKMVFPMKSKTVQGFGHISRMLLVL